jgi:hypothetical protein
MTDSQLPVDVGIAERHQEEDRAERNELQHAEKARAAQP